MFRKVLAQGCGSCPAPLRLKSLCQNLIAGNFGWAIYTLNVPRLVGSLSVRTPQALVLCSLKQVCEFDIH